jgi:protein TonB
MTSSQTKGAGTAGTSLDFRKRRMGYALALSLVLHIGAALVFIIAGGFGTGGKTIHNLMIQEVELSPSISAPAKSEPAPTPPPPEMTYPEPAKAPDPEQPAPEPAAEQPSQSEGNNEKTGNLMSTPLGLGMTHGYFSGLSDGRSLRDDIRGYYFEMVEKINREWWDRAGLLTEPLRQDGIFEVLVQRDGTIVSLRMLKGTGSREADRVLEEIIRKASPLPPLPATFDRSIFEAPLRIKAPSFLFR